MLKIEENTQRAIENNIKLMVRERNVSKSIEDGCGCVGVLIARELRAIRMKYTGITARTTYMREILSVDLQANNTQIGCVC